MTTGTLLILNGSEHFPPLESREKHGISLINSFGLFLCYIFDINSSDVILFDLMRKSLCL
jgi:hypothetical protein